MCSKFWTVLQLCWSTVYVICGAGQLISGIFFLISIPVLHLSCNVWTGSWNVIIGIVGGMVSCMGRLTPRRQECLLYLGVSILTVNSVSVVLSEWGLYVSDLTDLLNQHPNHMLIDYACFATRVATATVIITSFVDSQFAFCSMQRAPKPQKKAHSHEQVSDIEYIIPRPKAAKSHSTLHNAYSQSWVFEADSAATSSSQTPAEYLKVLENGTTPKTLSNGDVTATDPSTQIDKPLVHVEEASSEEGDRKLGHMRSFSRSTSPVMSGGSSKLDLAENNVYRTHLTPNVSPPPPPRPPSRSPAVSDKVHYASLMKELQAAISDKKSPSTSTTSSTSTEFSKELEAALRIIQDLESPKTPEEPPPNGKPPSPPSQSTSGYSSPSQPWSTTSSLCDMAYEIRTAPRGTVISLYAAKPPPPRSVTLVHISEKPPPPQQDKGWIRSLMRKKKTIPRLCPELEGAIVKSESLAYLSENELLQRREEIQREIEERVIQHLGAPRTESNC